MKEIINEPLFAAKKKIYPQNVKGKFRRIKWIINSVLLLIYPLIPLLRYNRGFGVPNQAILFDITNRKIYFFGIEIWPQEVYYLMGILILSAVLLFFITSLLGRIWCGYVCFQTVFTDIFIAIERFFQGDRNERILLDRKKMSFQNISRKTATHLSWIAVSLLTGFIFTWYFNDVFELIRDLFGRNLSLDIIGWSIGIAVPTYILAGFAREQVCTFMCPYSRFQSVMFDRDTLIIAYDPNRGEPRGKYKQGESFAGRGHCIDCKQCVVVCPTGIDIRNGLQMECIACGLCVDACNNVMEKIGLPKGLIRYDTESGLASIDASDKNRSTAKGKVRFFRIRTIYYLSILSLASALMGLSLIFKPDIEINIIPDRNPAYVMLSNGEIRDGYLIKILNKSHQVKQFRIEVVEPKSANLYLQHGLNLDLNSLSVPASQQASFKIYVALPKEELENTGNKKRVIDFIISEKNSNKTSKLKATFIGGD